MARAAGDKVIYERSRRRIESSEIFAFKGNFSREMEFFKTGNFFGAACKYVSSHQSIPT
jgi:hypothetical protein